MRRRNFSWKCVFTLHEGPVLRCVSSQRLGGSYTVVHIRCSRCGKLISYDKRGEWHPEDFNAGSERGMKEDQDGQA